MTDPGDELTIGQLKLLVSAAEERSFTRAAGLAGLSPAAVSKIVRRLEQRLGVALFVRTTRQTRLTEVGEHYVARCREALATLEAARRAAASEQASPSGRLRISVPTPYAYWRLLPKLGRFRALHPAIALSIQVSDRPVNLAGEEYDVAIRGFHLPDSGLMARKIEDAELVVVASPAYLAGAPPLREPGDLAQHHCIQFKFPNSGRLSPWTFRQGATLSSIETSGDIVCEDAYLAGIPLARAGAGLYQMYRFAVEADLIAGDLVEVLPDHGGTTRPFHLVYPGSGSPSAGLRAFIDFVVDEVAPQPRNGLSAGG